MTRALSFVLLPLLATGSALAAHSAPEFIHADARGLAVHVDNDLFSGAHRDEDYSWGFTATFAAPSSNSLLAPLDRARERVDRWLTAADGPDGLGSFEHRSVQVGLIAMTPETLRSAEPILDDRPYASLAFVASSSMQLLGERRARFSSFTAGVLGLDMARSLHAKVHELVDDEEPLGWEHQISSGGELTMRYARAEQWLLRDTERDRHLPELKLTAQGSVGYLTEGSLALSGRWGQIRSPWWGFSPELVDYASAPVAPVVTDAPGFAEWFLFAGVRLKARAYNALLQGQFRHSEVRIAAKDLARLHAEAWIGLSSTWSSIRLAYTLRYATKEFTAEPGARSLIWAGVSFEKAY